MDYEQYYNDGKETAGEIIEQIKPYLLNNGKSLTVLDWGCGPGRILRHLPDMLPGGSKIFGADYNEKYVDWCNANLKDVECVKSDLHPPSPFNKESFDFIFGISVITHLSANSIKLWMKELARVLNGTGILYLTIQGDAFKMKLMPSEQELFSEGKVITRGNVREGHRLYSTFQPGNNFEEMLVPYFKILVHSTNPGNEQVAQDIWILQKK